MIYPRGSRGIIGFEGIVGAISENAIAIERGNKIMVFRLSEIKLIEKLKPKSES